MPSAKQKLQLLADIYKFLGKATLGGSKNKETTPEFADRMAIKYHMTKSEVRRVLGVVK